MPSSRAALKAVPPAAAPAGGPDPEALLRVVRQALAEDVGRGDLTTTALIGPTETCEAELLLGEPGVVCGLQACRAVFAELDPGMRFVELAMEGQLVPSPSPVARLHGRARAVLSGERTALNLLGRLSGVATLARSYVEEVAGTGTVVLDTRKTTPGLRDLEKYATRTGGATNHRSGLDAAILVKDNHLRLSGGIAPAVRRLRRTAPGMPVEVEVETLEQVTEALAAGADVLLLDNMELGIMAEAVAVVGGRARLEASGGVSLSTVRAVALTGVDFVSVGALTRSARSLDVSLEVL